MTDLRELLQAAAPRPPALDLDDVVRRSGDRGRSSARRFAVGIAAVAAVAVVAIAIAWKGQGSSPAERVTSAMLERGAADVSAGTARMRGTITRDAGSGQIRVLQVQGAWNGAEVASEIHSTDGELLGSTETRTIGDSAYQRLPGSDRWVRMFRDPAVASQLNLTNPFSFLTVFRDLARIETLGTDEIDGVAVTKSRVTIDMEAMMKRLPPKYRDDASDASRVFEVWVDEHGRVRRLKGTEHNTQVTFRYDLEFYDFGADIHIDEPPANEVVEGGAATGQTPG